MKITVVGILILIGGIVLLAIVLDRLGDSLNENKEGQSQKENGDGNGEPKNPNN